MIPIYELILYSYYSVTIFHNTIMNSPQEGGHDNIEFTELQEEEWEYVVLGFSDVALYKDLAEFVVGYETTRSDLGIEIFHEGSPVGFIQRRFTEKSTSFTITFAEGFTQSPKFKGVFGQNSPDFIQLIVSDSDTHALPQVRYDTFTDRLVDQSETEEFERDFVENLAGAFKFKTAEST